MMTQCLHPTAGVISCNTRNFSFLFFFILFSSGIFSQEINFEKQTPKCDSDGKIIVWMDDNTFDARFFITDGPICQYGVCPAADNPDGVFQSLPPGEYTITAFDERGELLDFVVIDLEGTYDEPIISAEATPASCGSNGAITVSQILGGRDPFTFRVFPGNVIDYCTTVGPLEVDVPFVNQMTFTGLNPYADLIPAVACNPPGTPNPLPGFWTFQVKDACNVIRSNTVFIEDALTFKDPVFDIDCSNAASCDAAISNIRIFSDIFSSSTFSMNKILTDPVFEDMKLLLPISVIQISGAGAPRVLDVLDFNDPIDDFYPISHACDDPIRISLQYQCGGNQFDVQSKTIVKECFPPVRYGSYIAECGPDLDSIQYFLRENKLLDQELYTYCKDEVHLTIRDVNLNVTLFEGDLKDVEKTEWTFSAINDLVFEFENLCSNTTDEWYPLVPPPNRDFRFSTDFLPICGSEYWVDIDINNGFPEGVNDIVLTSAPSSYQNNLPESLGEDGSTFGPSGQYCYQIISDCKTLEQCVDTPVDVGFDVNYITKLGCSSFLFEWDLMLEDTDSQVEVLLYAYQDDGNELISVNNLTKANRDIMVAIDPSYCGDKIRFDIVTFGEICYSVYEDIPCYMLPDKAEVFPIKCPNTNCTDATVNITVTGPLEGGSPPFTFWLFEEGKDFSNAAPMQEVKSNDAMATFTGICSEILPLDIFITDDCGQQILTQVSFGDTDLGIVPQSTAELCPDETFDLMSLAPIIAQSGRFEGLGSAPALNGSVFEPTTAQINDCFRYRFILEEGSFEGQCGEIRDTVIVCVNNCDPNPEGQLSGVVWNDAQKNGVRDASEATLEGILVSLYDINGGFIAETNTDQNGMYLFVQLYEADYYIAFDLPNGYEYVDADLGANDDFDSDVSEVFGMGTTDVISLAKDEIQNNWDAGIQCIPIPKLSGLDNKTFSCSEMAQFDEPDVEYVCDLSSEINVPIYRSTVDFSLDQCDSDDFPQNAEYGEFLADVENHVRGAELTVLGGSVYRENDFPFDNSHYCSVGTNGTSALSVDPSVDCSFNDNSMKKIKIDIFAIPPTGKTAVISEFRFMEQAPTEYAMMNGDSGTNNHPKFYGIRIMKNNEEVYREVDKLTSSDWSIESFSFLGTNGLSFDEPSVFNFELLAYCPVDRAGMFTLWNIDDISIKSIYVDTLVVGPVSPSKTCGEAVLTFVDNSLPGSCGGDMIERTWTATDACGNSSTSTQILEPLDGEAPVFTGLNADGVYECGTIPLFSTPTASDDCSEVEVEINDITSEGPCGIDITRVWTAKDDCGNVSEISQTLTAVDTKAPIFAFLEAEKTYPCSGDPSFDSPDVHDDCTEVTLDFKDEILTALCGSNIITRVWTASDACGNVSSVSQSLIPVDITEPVFASFDAMKEFECGSTNPSFDVLLASDDCGAVVMDFMDSVERGPCGGERYIRTWTAEDECGNIATATQTLEPVDNASPSFLDEPTSGTFECGTTPSFANIEAEDSCGGVTIDFSDENSRGECGAENITRTWVATDECGNTSSISQLMEGEDSTAPTLSGVGINGEYQCGTNPIFSDPEAVDNCSNVQIVISNATTPSECGGETITRTWTATDECGNMTSLSQSMVAVDTEAPLFGNNPLVVEFDCGSNPNFAEPNYSDNCSSTSLSFTDVESNGVCGTTNIIRTWTATDACNNTSVFVQEFESIDNTAPIINGVTPIGTYDCNSGPQFSDPSTDDDCSSVSLDYVDIPGTDGCLEESITRTWVATDACGNQTTATQLLTLDDNSAPTIDGVMTDGTYTCGDIPEFSANVYVSKAHFDFDECYSRAFDFSSEDYSEFTSVVESETNAPEIDESSGRLYRIIPWNNRHSCTPGVNGSIAMCVDYHKGCWYDAGNQKSVVIDIHVEPNPNLENSLRRVSFFEKSALTFNFIDGATGPSNPPKYYGVRVLKNGVEIYLETDLSGSSDWSFEQFDFSGPEFRFNEPTDFKIELLAYCLDDRGANLAVWDLDELTVFVVSEDSFVSADDDCVTPSLSYSDSFTQGSCSGPDLIREWTATDDCGNVTTRIQTLVAELDIDPPFFSDLEPDTTHVCGGSPIFANASAEDYCSDVSLTYEDFESDQKITRVWTATDECGNVSTASQTSKADCETFGMAIYPNPTQGALTVEVDIKLEGFVLDKIELFHMNGSKVKDFIISKPLDEAYTNKMEINMGEIPEGAYLLRVKIGNKRFTEKVIVIH